MKKTPQNRPKSVDEIVGHWTTSAGSTQEFAAIRDLLKFLSVELYDSYQPFAKKPLFWDRLGSWLGNVKSEIDQQRLLKLVPWLLYVGTHEMEAMYEAAFAGPITRWIIDEAGLDITAGDLDVKFQREISRTFFGSMAGMNIDGFARINGLAGQSHRPNFREHAILGDWVRFRDEVIGRGYIRFVAVEDMVGTGTQMREAAELLEQMAPNRVLFCPIIVAPDGVKTWWDELADKSHFDFNPLFVIPANATLPERKPRKSEEHVEVGEFRMLLKKTWDKVKGTSPSQQLYGPFGYGDFGSLVLSYLNCPDNVPPLVHYESTHWKPLFPRLSRE